MTAIFVVGEDALCCALGEKLVTELLPGWRLALASLQRAVARIAALGGAHE